MTGTALTANSELDHIYHMPVVPVPTNKPVIREDKGDLIFRTAEAKFAAVADEVERRHAKGQPVLVGTASVSASERLSEKLAERGIGHRVLNAKEHEREAVGNPLFDELCTQIMLRTMDTHWVAHLTDMEGVKAGIGLRACGHRDPLVEYKEEAYRAFSRLVDSIYEDSLRAILRLPVESAGAAPGGLSEEDNPFRPESMVYSDSRSAPGAPPLDAPDPAGGETRSGSCLRAVAEPVDIWSLSSEGMAAIK